jgi:hypothetical protein
VTKANVEVGVEHDATVPRCTRDALIMDGLAVVFDHLEEREDTATVRAQQAQARSYERALKRWSAIPPNDDQIAAMLALVSELLVAVTTPSEVSPLPPPARARRSNGV